MGTVAERGKSCSRCNDREVMTSYHEHREDLIDMKMAVPANWPEKRGRVGSCSLSASGAPRSTRTSSSIPSIDNPCWKRRKTPKKYRDLVVGIAGYCAYFVDLTPSQQAEIIARTEAVRAVSVPRKHHT